jgi:hypothetical protein
MFDREDWLRTSLKIDVRLVNKLDCSYLKRGELTVLMVTGYSRRQTARTSLKKRLVRAVRMVLVRLTD